jgi:isoleucyl-tRNA synthetase
MSKQTGRENDSIEVVPEVSKCEVSLREEEIQKFWEENDIFNKTITNPAGDSPVCDYVFYDGPPFATGTPHYGHILAGTMKDTVSRFWTMNGQRVKRKWGWDCHGLPLENLIEKKLGLATKRDIETYGIKNFNEAARSMVMEYADYWKKVVPRMGRWVDMENDYRTMDSTYTESVWWVFSELNKKGLVFEGFKTMHLCPRCETTLSNFEVNQGYKDVKDIAVTVKLPILNESSEETDTSLLVWTTTPWTLPGNIAAAVNNEIDYVKVKVTHDGVAENYILAKGRLAQLDKQEYEIVSEMKGSDLIGLSYKPPFDYLSKKELDGKQNGWKVWHADYVEVGEEGTGIVHIAPAYGDDDMKLAQANNVPIVHHVSTSGHFLDFVTDFAGQLVKPKDDDAAGVDHKDADIEILKYLQATGRVVKKENITHSYPHCWRCDTPLLNYATTSWFVNVPKIKDSLVEENSKVHWVPGHVGQNRFGKWLEGARDWAISRQRYWGAPLPIWKNPKTGEYKIFGSLAEIQEYVPKTGNTYTIMRHAEAESNLSGVIDAVADEKNPLTSDGINQAKEAAVILADKKITKIVHSGMQRARQTAEVIAASLGLSKEAVLEDIRLQEFKVGTEYEGKTWAEFNANFASEEEKFTKQFAGGESRYDLIKRVGDFLYEYDAKNKNENTLIVGHGSSMFAIEAVASGADYKNTIVLKKKGYLKNAEIKDLSFRPLPHNDLYQLDFHRPYIDDFVLTDRDGTKLERVPDVFDCWFESGSMPYGQLHYPFENSEEFLKEYFPAKFIAEGLDQTRGWFYSTLVLGTALFGKSPFENVIVNGLVLAEDGKKMSKSLRNYPDPMELADRVGVDAIRYYMLSSPIVRAEDLNFSEKETLDVQRKNIGRLHNVLAMYEMFANGTESISDSNNVLDKWIISRLSQLIKDSTVGYKNYELDKAVRPIADFIEDVSVWYLRRSRERLKGDDEQDKRLALGTLRYLLKTLAQVMAPSMPFYAEYLYRAVKEEGAAESVHLTAWPKGDEPDPVVLGEMSLVREFVTIALEARTKANIKVRQPLAKLSLNIEMNSEYADIIADEINVKEVSFAAGQSDKVVLDLTITPELKAEGEVREFMRFVQDRRKQEGLAPQDRIELMVSTTEAGQKTLEDFKDMIMKNVGATLITYSETAGERVKAGETDFVVSLRRI